jgi:heat shock protein HslJ
MVSLNCRRVLGHLIALSALALPSTLTSCGADSPGGRANDVEGQYWQLVRLRDAAIAPVPPPKGAYLMLDSHTQRLIGSGGCNQLMGTYHLDGHSLTFGPIAATRMACLDEHATTTETNFLSALGDVKGWKMEGKQLALTDASARTLAQFDERAPAAGQ